MPRIRLLGIVCLTIILATACKQNEPPSDEVVHIGTNATIYTVKGVIKELLPSQKQVRIAHEEIPGYMGAMTMKFDVKDAKALDGLRPGDVVTFRLVITEDDGWIAQINQTGVNVGTNVASSTPVSDFFPKELKVGQMVPDCLLTNQFGRALRLSEFKGDALAFTFIFTRCPFPDFCPRMNKNFEAAFRQLSSGSRTNWHLLSISFDPVYDTPERLAEYARRYRTNSAAWDFATGATNDIRNLGGSFGLMFHHIGELFEHNVRTVVVDPDGRLRKVFSNNMWTPEELVSEMKAAMNAR